MEKDIASLINLESKLSSLTNNHSATISELKSRITKLKTKKSKIIHDMDELGFILEKSDKASLINMNLKLKLLKDSCMKIILLQN